MTAKLIRNGERPARPGLKQVSTAVEETLTEVKFFLKEFRKILFENRGNN